MEDDDKLSCAYSLCRDVSQRVIDAVEQRACASFMFSSVRAVRTEPQRGLCASPIVSTVLCAYKIVSRFVRGS